MSGPAESHPDPVLAPSGAAQPQEGRETAASLRAGPAGGRRGDLSPGTSGYRQRRLQSRRAGRRALRLRWVARLVTLAVLLTAIFLGIRAVRGHDADSRSDTPTGSVLLLSLRDGGSPRAAVLVDPAYHRPLVVGMPSATLLQTPSAFAVVYRLLGADDRTGLLAGVESLFGVRPAAVAELTWSDVRQALTQAGDVAVRPRTLSADAAGAQSAAEAIAALARATSMSRGKDLNAATLADGEAGRLVLETLRGLGARGRAATLPGAMVFGSTYTYYEPDVVGVQVLTGRKVEQALTVEVQNGSGKLGAAESVSAVLAPRGYRLPPPRNADGFPDVKKTEIRTREESRTEATRIQTILGVGTVVLQNDLPARRIVIVVGKDLDPRRVEAGTTPPTAK